MSILLKSSILLSLCLSNALYTVIRRESVKRENIPTEEIVFGSEILKILLCLYQINSNKEETNSQGKGISKVIWLIRHSSQMILIAISYLIMNILSFLCLNFIGSGEFTVYSRLNILTTAIFSTIILGTQFSYTKWRALCLLMIGCILVASPVFNHYNENNSSGSGNSNNNSNNSNNSSDINLNTIQSKHTFSKSIIGYIMTIIQVIISGFVTIYFEKVVKSTTEKITVWERNFQLSFYSIILCIALKFFPSLNGSIFSSDSNFSTSSSSSSSSIPFSNWSFLTVLVMILGSINGLLVAATLKYADAILKVLAQAGAIIIAAALGYLFQNDPMDIFIILGCLTSILAIMNYTFDESNSTSSSSSSTSLNTVSLSSSTSSSSSSTNTNINNTKIHTIPSFSLFSSSSSSNNKKTHGGDDDDYDDDAGAILIDKKPTRTSIV